MTRRDHLRLFLVYTIAWAALRWRSRRIRTPFSQDSRRRRERRIRSRRWCVSIAAATRPEHGSVPTQALTRCFSTCRRRTKGG